jgi:SAM-dependent methyltransferase
MQNWRDCKYEGTKMDQTKIWDYFQNDEEIGDTFIGARTRYEFIAKKISPGTRVLNIGVGRGGLENILVQYGVQVSCLDPSENSINNIKQLLNLGDRAKVGFSQAIPFDSNEFDVVIMSEVLEHLSDEVIAGTFSEVARVLKPDGKYFGTVPADERLLDNKVMCPHCGLPFHRWGHIQTFDYPRLSKLLGERFSEISISRHYFVNFKTLNWLGKFASLLKITLLAMGKKGSGETFYFSASSK